VPRHRRDHVLEVGKVQPIERHLAAKVGEVIDRIEIKADNPVTATGQQADDPPSDETRPADDADDQIASPSLTVCNGVPLQLNIVYRSGWHP
jgi:hypothetical protein